jgi:ubiquitin-conjugating enzyme E2 I
LIPIRILFPLTYPREQPKIQAVSALFHVNLYPSGTFSAPLLSGGSYHPSLTIQELLLGAQDFLCHDNLEDPAMEAPFKLGRRSRGKYVLRYHVPTGRDMVCDKAW